MRSKGLVLFVSTGLLLLAIHPAMATDSPIKNCQPDLLTSTGKLDFSQYHGKVLYLDFWASWCEPCRFSFPVLNALQTHYDAKDFALVGISVDETKKSALGFLKETPATFTVALDSTGVCPTELGVQGMPTSYIFDRDGKLVFTHQGFRKADEVIIRAKLDELLQPAK